MTSNINIKQMKKGNSSSRDNSNKIIVKKGYKNKTNRRMNNKMLKINQIMKNINSKCFELICSVDTSISMLSLFIFAMIIKTKLELKFELLKNTIV